jgi:ribosomal protein S27AE
MIRVVDFHGCPRCNGVTVLVDEREGPELSCMRCGWRKRQLITIAMRTETSDLTRYMAEASGIR